MTSDINDTNSSKFRGVPRPRAGASLRRMKACRMPSTHLQKNLTKSFVDCMLPCSSCHRHHVAIATTTLPFSTMAIMMLMMTVIMIMTDNGAARLCWVVSLVVESYLGRQSLGT